jgi:hypothetical protein
MIWVWNDDATGIECLKEDGVFSWKDLSEFNFYCPAL